MANKPLVQRLYDAATNSSPAPQGQQAPPPDVSSPSWSASFGNLPNFGKFMGNVGTDIGQMVGNTVGNRIGLDDPFGKPRDPRLNAWDINTTANTSEMAPGTQTISEGNPFDHMNPGANMEYGAPASEFQNFATYGPGPYQRMIGTPSWQMNPEARYGQGGGSSYDSIYNGPPPMSEYTSTPTLDTIGQIYNDGGSSQIPFSDISNQIGMPPMPDMGSGDTNGYDGEAPPEDNGGEQGGGSDNSGGGQVSSLSVKVPAAKASAPIAQSTPSIGAVKALDVVPPTTPSTPAAPAAPISPINNKPMVNAQDKNLGYNAGVTGPITNIEGNDIVNQAGPKIGGTQTYDPTNANFFKNYQDKMGSIKDMQDNLAKDTTWTWYDPNDHKQGGRTANGWVSRPASAYAGPRGFDSYWNDVRNSRDASLKTSTQVSNLNNEGQFSKAFANQAPAAYSNLFNTPTTDFGARQGMENNLQATLRTSLKPNVENTFMNQKPSPAAGMPSTNPTARP